MPRSASSRIGARAPKGMARPAGVPVSEMIDCPARSTRPATSRRSLVLPTPAGPAITTALRPLRTASSTVRSSRSRPTSGISLAGTDTEVNVVVPSGPVAGTRASGLGPGRARLAGWVPSCCTCETPSERAVDATVVDVDASSVGSPSTARPSTRPVAASPTTPARSAGLPVDRRPQGGGDLVWHTVAVTGRCPASATPSTGAVDWDRRHALMRTHTALHVLCGVIWNEWRVPVTGGNMEPLAARMDFEFDPLPEGFGARVEELVNAELAADRPIEVSFLPVRRAVMDDDLIRTKVNMIPESVTEIRVVDIVGLDKQADGGTHVRIHRRGRPHPGHQDRVQGQGQQAHPDRGARCLTPTSLALRSHLRGLGPVVVRVLGGCRLGLPGVGGPRHARAGPRARRHRGVAVAARRRTRRLRRPGRRVGDALAGGRHRRARQPRLRPQRRRPLLLVQGRPARRHRPDRRSARAPRSCSA